MRNYVSQINTDKEIAFATNADANVQVSVNFGKAPGTGKLLLTVYNPSTQTDLTCKIFLLKASLGTAVRSGLVTTVSIPKSQAITGTTVNAYVKILEIPHYDSDITVIFSNDTGTTLTAFSAFARLECVNDIET